MTVTYNWSGYLDTGMVSDEGQIITNVYSCSVCHANVSENLRDDHTDYHEPPSPDPEPEPEPDPEPPTS